MRLIVDYLRTLNLLYLLTSRWFFFPNICWSLIVNSHWLILTQGNLGAYIKEAFLQEEFVLGLMAFSVTVIELQWCNPFRLSWSVGFSCIALTVLSIESCMLWTIKAVFTKRDIWGQVDHFNACGVELMGFWVATWTLPNIKRTLKVNHLLARYSLTSGTKHQWNWH